MNIDQNAIEMNNILLELHAIFDNRICPQTDIDFIDWTFALPMNYEANEWVCIGSNCLKAF